MDMVLLPILRALCISTSQYTNYNIFDLKHTSMHTNLACRRANIPQDVLYNMARPFLHFQCISLGLCTDIQRRNYPEHQHRNGDVPAGYTSQGCLLQNDERDQRHLDLSDLVSPITIIEKTLLRQRLQMLSDSGSLWSCPCRTCAEISRFWILPATQITTRPPIRPTITWSCWWCL